MTQEHLEKKMQSADVAKLMAVVDRMRVRRHAWFCMYYRPKDDKRQPDAGEIWSSLSELDNVLGDFVTLGLIEAHWQSRVPEAFDQYTGERYNGGFSDGYLETRLKPEDLRAIGL